MKEYIQKGFVLNDERLKQGETVFGKDYFKELLERIMSIRASERRIWQQITDIFAECSLDYDKDSPITQNFYATIQNKQQYKAYLFCGRNQRKHANHAIKSHRICKNTMRQKAF